MSLDRINALRQRQAKLAAQKETALRSKQEVEQSLQEIGWDGKQPVAEFVDGLKKQYEDAASAAETAITQAEALAKEFDA